MEYGSCRSTKDIRADKFYVLDCNGAMIDSARTLDEAQVRADAEACAFVIKILRICGEADIAVFPGISEVGEESEEGDAGLDSF